MDEITASKFLLEISKCYNELFKSYQETLDYWYPENPPVTIAYSEVGQRIADIFFDIDSLNRSKIIEKIEIGMNSDNDTIGIAVATGLVEGLVGRSHRIGNWQAVRSALGPLTRQHADAWCGS